MRDRLIALIFVVVGIAVVNSGCREDIDGIAHLFSNCECINDEIVGMASIDQFKPLGRSDVKLKEQLGNPRVTEFEDYEKFDETWSYHKYRLVLCMKHHRCIAAYPCSNVFH